MTKSFLFVLLAHLSSPASATEARAIEGLIILPEPPLPEAEIPLLPQTKAPFSPETGTLHMGDNCDYQPSRPGV